MLRIYQRLWQVNWAEQWQYRANLAMYVLYWLVSPIVYLAVWSTVASTKGSVAGLTANDFVTYYLTLLIVDNLTADITIHLLAYKIYDGTLSGDLLKPVHPVLTGVLMNNLAFKALNFMVIFPVWLALCLLMRPDFSAVTLGSVLLGIPAIVLGFLVRFVLGACLTFVGFWTTRVYSLEQLYMAFVILFGGQFVPLTLMPPAFQTIAQILPFQIAYYVPVQIILNRLPPEVILRDFAVGLVWLVVAAVLFSRVWRAGLKQFSAVGA